MTHCDWFKPVTWTAPEKPLSSSVVHHFCLHFQYLVLEKQLYNSPFPFIACNQHCCDSASFGGHASSQLHMQPSNHHGVYVCIYIYISITENINRTLRATIYTLKATSSQSWRKTATNSSVTIIKDKNIESYSWTEKIPGWHLKNIPSMTNYCLCELIILCVWIKLVCFSWK